MSVKCGKCDSVITADKNSVTCTNCKLQFHSVCTRASSSQNLTKYKLAKLKCDSCCSESSSLHSNEEAEDKPTILEALNCMKKEINVNIDSKVGGIQVSLDNITEELRHLRTKVEVVEEDQKKTRERCDRLEHANNELSGEVRELRLAMQDMEQHSRCTNLEMQGLPSTTGEDVYEALGRIAQVIGVAYKREDISLAHRLRQYSKRHSHPPLVVQFISRSVKEGWLKAVRTRKGLNASEIGLKASPVFLNEHLTPHNKALLGRARRLVREKKLQFATFVNGKVIIKHREGDDTVRVTAIQEMDKFD